VQVGDDRTTYPLDEVRTDGWLGKLAEATPSFDQLCELVGQRFVAFAVVSGVQITSIAYDRNHPDASTVEFAIGQASDTHSLPLGEFRQRLANSLATDESYPTELPQPPGVEALQRFIGLRHILLAPVFDIRLESLHVGGDEPPSVSFTHDGEAHEALLEELRETIREAVRQEAAEHASAGPFSLDLELAPKAQEAADAERWSEVVDLLGQWPGPLSVLLRTAQGQSLDAEVRTLIARSLGLLGTAHVRQGNPEWGEEIMRLAIQWGRDAPVSGELFRRLGDAHVERGRFGEAIGLLRRSLTLGAAPSEVLPLLARCFVERGRFVAAMACVEQGLAAGASEEAVATSRGRACERLGTHWERLRQEVPQGGSIGDTVRPPPAVTSSSARSPGDSEPPRSGSRDA
jgi:hypothetical protein